MATRKPGTYSEKTERLNIVLSHAVQISKYFVISQIVKLSKPLDLLLALFQ